MTYGGGLYKQRYLLRVGKSLYPFLQFNEHGNDPQEVESAFALFLSQLYRQEVMVFFREEMRLVIVAYSKKDGLPVQKILDLPAVLSRNQFMSFLEDHLATAAVIKQVRRLKGFERRLV